MLDPRRTPQTLPEMAHRSFVTHASRPFLGAKPDKSSDYTYQTYGDVARRVHHLALGMLARGIQRGDRIAILSENRPEWALCDLAAQMCGAVIVPIYPALPANQIAPMLRDCGATWIFYATSPQAKKLDALRDEFPDLRRCDFDGESDTEDAASFKALEREGEAAQAENPTLYETTWPAAQPDDPATIIYTSGTSGEPKGVVLSHRNITSNAAAIARALQAAFGDSKDELFLSILPLAHIYERVAGYYFPLHIGATIAYAEGLTTIDRNLRETRPTMMFCVPRLYESLRDKLRDASKSMPDSKKSKYLDALALAEKVGRLKGNVAGAPGLSLVERAKLAVYEKMVYKPIRDKLGGRLRAFVSGGAPMSAELAAPFLGVGISILEGYGLTETTIVACNRPGRIKLGTVGEIMDGMEVKTLDDGEICVRGEAITRGYFNKPEATSDAIDGDGWFHTGDIGELSGGSLRITDRKKDLLVLPNGKKVAPAPLESRVQESPYIAQAVLTINPRGVAGLLVPNFPELRRALSQPDASDDDLAAHDETKKLLRAELDRLTQGVADWEKVRAFAIVPRAFTVDGGELTPTLKVKRRVVHERYGGLLE